MKRILSPVYLLIIVTTIALFIQKPVLVMNEAASSHPVSIMNQKGLWEEWCVYKFADGSTSKKYLYTVDPSNTEEPINTQALKECS